MQIECVGKENHLLHSRSRVQERDPDELKQKREVNREHTRAEELMDVVLPNDPVSKDISANTKGSRHKKKKTKKVN